MILSDLEALPSFALLGPGFGGSWLLAPSLRADPEGQLVFARFEDTAHARFAGDFQGVSFAFEAVAPRPPPVLHASRHGEAVARIRSAIEAGDVYQVCFTVRAELAPCTGASLLSSMCRAGAPRFAAWVRFPGGPELVCASPELLLESRGRAVRSEPMKGTARPGEAGPLDASEKDRAELAMITDLVRNDLTQVCVPRSVEVPCERRILELPYALQTVSDVTGTLAEGLGPMDVLSVLHPGGSVVGAPRPAALSMIRQLEEGPRGAYCGTLGLVHGMDAVVALLIRTAARHPGGWTYGVGSGIVHDSDAAAEAAELQVKLGAVS